MINLLKDYIPNDSARQAFSEYYIKNILKRESDSITYKVLDLGCGTGKSLEYFKSLGIKIEWYGIDIKYSPEAANAKGIENYVIFDGINLPFKENTFDLIYCRQVFEHVRFPEKLLSEVQRVLKYDGYLTGSTSHLEPYHSYSYWNFTPYGFCTLIHSSSMKLVALRPGIDSLTLIIRRGLGCPGFFDIFWKIESPLNFLITVIGKLFRISNHKLNLIKLLFCGHFIFLAKKEKA